jgi:hypothetical protein
MKQVVRARSAFPARPLLVCSECREPIGGQDVELEREDLPGSAPRGAQVTRAVGSRPWLLG